MILWLYIFTLKILNTDTINDIIFNIHFVIYSFSDGVLKTYLGGMNFKEYIRSTMSPCGSYVFCGSENGLVNVWQTETGKNVVMI